MDENNTKVESFEDLANLIKQTAKQNNERMEKSIAKLKNDLKIEIKGEILKEVKETEDKMNEKLAKIQDQLNEIKVSKLSNSSPGEDMNKKPTYAEALTRGSRYEKETIKDPKVEEIYEKAANTIGLAPISSLDIDRLVRTQEIDTTDGPTAGLLAGVTEYLELELKLSIDELGELENLKRIFKSKSKDDLVYVEFHDSAPVRKIYKQAGKIPNSAKRNFQLNQYIPQELFSKYKVASVRCKDLRSENPNLQTKIMIDNSGFRVKYKTRGDIYYRDMPRDIIGDLPSIEISLGRTVEDNISPPRGRQRDTLKRKEISPISENLLNFKSPAKPANKKKLFRDLQKTFEASAAENAR